MNRSSKECLHSVDQQVLYTARRVNNKLFALRIAASKQGLAVRCLNRKPVARDWRAILDYTSEWFDLARDLNPFYEQVRGDRVLSRLASRYTGLRLIGIPDLFEALVWSIIGQQINLTFAYTLKSRLVEDFGSKLRCAGRVYHVFPEPRDLAAISPNALFELQFTRRKAEAIVHLAQQMRSEASSLSKAALISLSANDLSDRLQQLPSVGPWTAQYVMMKCFRILSAFPVQDAGLARAVQRQRNLAAKPTTDSLVRYSRKWRGWEAYAVFYLWRSLID